jgi:hypothetical protein
VRTGEGTGKRGAEALAVNEVVTTAVVVVVVVAVVTVAVAPAVAV